MVEKALQKKWSFPLRISSVNVTKSTDNYVTQVTAGLVTFTKEIINGKLHFLCSETKKDASDDRSNSICFK